MLITIVQALFFFLPGYIANMCPVVFWKTKRLDFLKKPIDGGNKFGNHQLFGEHKTYFGFVVGVLGAVFTGLLQSFVYSHFVDSHWLFLFPYSYFFVFLLSFFMGFGALLGDLLKSFIKRRFRIPDGASFFPFDQLDFVIGGLLLVSLLYIPRWDYILVLFILTPTLHLSANFFGYKLGLKNVWW